MKEAGESVAVPKPVLYIFIVLAAGFLLYQVSPYTLTANLALGGSSANTGTGSGKINLDAIMNEVTPKSGITIGAVWGNAVQDMIKAGVLDVGKLRSTLQSKYGQQITADEERILTTPDLNERITINSDNAVFMMYIFGMLAKHNDNPIILNSPFKIPTIFSDAGRDGWGDVKLVNLTPGQQSIVQYTADNSYRPCCDQKTSRPDCTHGFSLLGLQELMASRGAGKEDIFRASVAFNSYWFPSNYVYDAIYFKVKENKGWSQVDPATIMGQDYSSLSGAAKVQSYLRDSGVI